MFSAMAGGYRLQIVAKSAVQQLNLAAGAHQIKRVKLWAERSH